MSNFPTEQMPQAQIQLPYATIIDLCQRFDVEQLAIFGSVLRPDFHADSDVDFLVTFINDDDGPWMSKLQGLETELAQTLGRDVDVVSRRGVEQSKNLRRRQAMLESARIIYER